MTQTPPTPPPKHIQPPTLHLNWQDWLPYLERSDAPDAEKRKFIEMLWNIMIAFAELDCPITDKKEISGQSIDLTSVLRAAVLYSKDTQKEEA